MKLKQLGSNVTELDMGDVQVFFSYETPVAARTDTGALAVSYTHLTLPTKRIV